MVEGDLEPQWLGWCRLCASDDAEIRVHDDEVHGDFVRIISKCFDVEMTLEEPELGSMLCHDCYTSISQLITFAENINKVQAIFELLRHTEANVELDMVEIRHQYGLPITAVKTEPSEDDTDGESDGNYSSPADEQVVMEEIEDDEVDEVMASHFQEIQAKKPLKRRRGRPKATVKNTRNHRKMPKQDDKDDDKDYTSNRRIGKNSSSLDNDISSRTCQICQVTLVTVAALKSHKYRVHGSQAKRFICDCCGKQLKTFTALAEHKLVHTDDRPCVCPICNAAFKNKARLRVHSQTHGDPSFQCNICGKKLQTRAILNKHKYVHIDERRFKCDVCGTGCKNSTALKVHLLSHAGLRPFVCKYCSKAFASNTNCRAHKLKKHPLEVEQEDEKESSRIPVPTLDELRALTREMAKTDFNGLVKTEEDN